MRLAWRVRWVARARASRFACSRGMPRGARWAAFTLAAALGCAAGRVGVVGAVTLFVGLVTTVGLGAGAEAFAAGAATGFGAGFTDCESFGATRLVVAPGAGVRVVVGASASATPEARGAGVDGAALDSLFWLSGRTNMAPFVRAAACVRRAAFCRAVEDFFAIVVILSLSPCIRLSLVWRLPGRMLRFRRHALSAQAFSASIARLARGRKRQSLYNVASMPKGLWRSAQNAGKRWYWTLVSAPLRALC